MAVKEVVYTLDDGSELTIKQMVDKSGLKKGTLYHRVARLKLTDPEIVFSTANNGNRMSDATSESWVDKPVKIYGGIPLNPSYMDGINKESEQIMSVCDRDGEIMSHEQKKALMQYRDVSRAQWRKERKNYIIGEK